MEQARGAFVAAVRAAAAQPPAARPGAAAWRAGPHAAPLALLEDLALGRECGDGQRNELAVLMQVRRRCDLGH